MIEKNVYSLSSKDLQVLTSKDLQDAFSIIHIANQYPKLPVMRTKIVKALKKAFQAKGVVFFLSDSELQSINIDNAISVGFNKHCVDTYNRYYRIFDPFVQDLTSRNMICKVDDIMPYSHWINTKAYDEFYRPQDMHYKLSISLRTNNRIFGLIGICRSQELQDFTEAEIVKAKILAPFLTEALENSYLFAHTNNISNPFKEYEKEPSSFGIIILDYELRPIYWNQKAQMFCIDKYHKCWEQNDQSANVTLPVFPDILEDCRSLKELFVTGNYHGPLRREKIIDAKKKKYQVVCSLVEHSFREASYLSFYIYLRDISGKDLFNEDLLREKYQLSRKEADIIRYVCQGLTNQEISEQLYISRLTVETHVKNIFDKTGIRHRAGLASLFHMN